MTFRYLHCRFLSYWHPGTGGGLGASLDARVRTNAGLPLLPGRTLKGVLRDACARAEALGWFKDLPTPLGGWTDLLFGRAAKDGRPSTPGLLRIGSAELDAPTRQAFVALDAKQQRLAARGMRAALHQTAIDERGVVVEGSLRGLEVYVPMPLYAPIEWVADGTGSESALGFIALDRSLALVEGLGGHRSRGFGRVELVLEDRP